MSRRTALAVVFAGIFVIGVTLAAGWYFWRQTRMVREVFTPHEQEVDLTTLVTRVRSLDRLETATMRVVHVGTITQSYRFVPDAFAGDEMTFLATGDVIAGVDLSQLRSEDVRREADGTVVLKLPPAQILVTRVDNRQSHVIDRKTGMFRRADVNLESRERQYAEQSIRNEAIKKGILPMASRNAEVRIAELLHMFGFPKVRCEIAAGSPSRG